MANETTKKTPIAYAMRPACDEHGNVVGYEKFNPVTTGNAVAVKVGEKQERLNDVLIRFKGKLDALSNYDDTEVRSLISDIRSALDTLTGVEDTTEIIDTFNGIINFLDSFKDSDSLASILSSLKTEIQNWVEGKDYYSKPEGGIPKTDLAQGVQASLGKADNAVPIDAESGVTKDGDNYYIKDKNGNVLTVPHTSVGAMIADYIKNNPDQQAKVTFGASSLQALQTTIGTNLYGATTAAGLASVVAEHLGNPIGSKSLSNDANTNIVNGVYRIATGSGFSSNLPETSAYGVLLVFVEKPSGAVSYGSQIFVSAISGNAFVRGYRVSGGVMMDNSGWKKITS